ncbi:hypothetical protein ACXHXM_34150
MSEAAAEVSFESQLAAATAEAEAEEAAYRERNGMLPAETVSETTSNSEETTEGDDDIAALKARIAELEAKQKEEPEGNEEESTADESQEGDEAETQEINGVQITNDDYEKWAPWYELVAKGEPLPDEAYAVAKERFGVSDRAMVDDYMRGRIASRNAAASEYATSVRSSSGDVDYDALMLWAGDNLSPAEIEEYDNVAHSKNVEAAKIATKALAYRMKSEGGVAPKPLTNTKLTAPRADVYGSMDEMVRDVNDPRYDKDRKFRAQVDEKIQRSEQAKSVSVTKGSRAY